MDAFIVRCCTNFNVSDISNCIKEIQPVIDTSSSQTNKPSIHYQLITSICDHLLKVDDVVDQYGFDERLCACLLNRNYDDLHHLLNEIQRWAPFVSPDIKNGKVNSPYFEIKFKWGPLQDAHSKYIGCQIDTDLMSQHVIAADNLYTKLCSVDRNHNIETHNAASSTCISLRRIRSYEQLKKSHHVTRIDHKPQKSLITDITWKLFQRELFKNVPDLGKCLDLYHMYTLHYKQ
jgi:hypothetical protein